MSPSAKPYPLATNKAVPLGGRSIRPRDFTLPKPYRRKRFVEDGLGMSRLRMWSLALSALVIAGLITTLALLAKENLDSPPIPIIAAPVRSAAPLSPALSAAAPAVVAAPPPPPEQTAPAHAAQPMAAPVPARLARAAAPTPATAVAPDPDVVLITAILTLTPPPEPEPATSCAVGDNHCATAHVPE